MILDQQNIISDNQPITAAGTTVSGNTLDLQGGIGPTITDTLGNTPVSDPGRSPDVEILFQVVETFVGGTSVQAQIVESAAANLGSPNVLSQTAVIPTATLKAGYNFRLALSPGVALRYLGANYISVGTYTAGKITAGIIGRDGAQTAPGTMS